MLFICFCILVISSGDVDNLSIESNAGEIEQVSSSARNRNDALSRILNTQLTFGEEFLTIQFIPRRIVITFDSARRELDFGDIDPEFRIAITSGEADFETTYLLYSGETEDFYLFPFCSHIGINVQAKRLPNEPFTQVHHDSYLISPNIGFTDYYELEVLDDFKIRLEFKTTYQPSWWQSQQCLLEKSITDELEYRLSSVRAPKTVLDFEGIYYPEKDLTIDRRFRYIHRSYIICPMCRGPFDVRRVVELKAPKSETTDEPESKRRKVDPGQFECPICYENMVDGNREGFQINSCKHAFCYECLMKIKETSKRASMYEFRWFPAEDSLL